MSPYVSTDLDYITLSQTPAYTVSRDLGQIQKLSVEGNNRGLGVKTQSP